MDTFRLLAPLHLPPAAELADAVRRTPLARALLELEGPRELALRTGLLEAEGGPGGELEVLRDGAPEEVLRLWSEVSFVAVHPAELGTEQDAVTLAELFLLGSSTEPPGEVLAGLGLVAPGGGLTPLGQWAGRRVFASLTGQTVPVFGSLADRDAPTLLYGLRSYSEDERREEVRGWLEGRDPAKAAQAIATVLADVSPLARTVGLQLLHAELGEEGVEALRSLLPSSKVGALAAARLGVERDSAAEEIAWVLVDMAASLLEYGGDSEQVVAAMAMGMNPGEQVETIAILPFGGHAETERVLLTLVEGHPDPAVVAAARKALRRARGLAEG
ncbi:hypothetical protein ACIBG7_36490 [Nonomuraea sp. NPDC050328]|uniref:hypothetical protein n=1 Tax=Nonomuraea sp. NPDC050328 TaxID=3364361 RepID=UPI0037AF8C3B